MDGKESNQCSDIDDLKRCIIEAVAAVTSVGRAGLSI
jgi:hypothetical protein